MSETTTEIPGGRRTAALGFIFVTALMDVIALGLMILVGHLRDRHRRR